MVFSVFKKKLPFIVNDPNFINRVNERFSFVNGCFFAIDEKDKKNYDVFKHCKIMNG